MFRRIVKIFKFGTFFRFYALRRRIEIIRKIKEPPRSEILKRFLYVLWKFGSISDLAFSVQDLSLFFLLTTLLTLT